MKFERLKFYDVEHGISEAVVFFPNGLGARVRQDTSERDVREFDLYNLDVLKAVEPHPKGRLGRDSELSRAHGVVRRGSREDIERALSEIAAFPKHTLGVIPSETPVYTASAWWRDSDPSMQVVTLTRRRTEELIEEMMAEAAHDAYDDGSYEDADEALDDIAWSGVHASKLGDLATSDELEEAALALESDGVWYPGR